jgi:hypothetical protein
MTETIYKMLAQLLIIVGFITKHFVLGHGQRYPQLQNISCSAPFPPVISYHAHIIYILTNPDEIAQAMVVRQQVIKQFKDYLGPDCGRALYDTAFVNIINCSYKRAPDFSCELKHQLESLRYLFQYKLIVFT